MSRAFPVGRALAVVAAASLTLAACGSDKDEATPQASASSSSKASDGALKLGTLLPATGNLAILGPPQVAGIKLAVKEINAAGGVLDHDVTYESKDSGDPKTNIASQSVDSLLDAGVDAIIGAASSTVTLTVLSKVTGNGVLMFSPAATSTKLTDAPDKKGLFWRTAPSDIFQGRVVGETAANDGAETLSILALQDAYGTSLADQAEKAFKDAGGAVKEKIIYDPTAAEYSSEVSKIKAADAEAIALIGFEESSKIIAEMVKQEILPLKKSGKKLYFVDGNLSNTYDVAAGTLAGVKGTLPGSEPDSVLKGKLAEFDSALQDYSYAGEAYDSVMLIALSAIAAKSDDGNAIAAKLQSSSSGGEKCTTFEACSKLAKDGKDFDYDGISGPVEFDAKGDPSIASMGVYVYGDNNKYAPLQFVKGPVAGGDMTTTKASGASSSSSSSTASPSPSATSSSSSSSDEDEDDETASPSPSATSTP